MYANIPVPPLPNTNPPPQVSVPVVIDPVLCSSSYSVKNLPTGKVPRKKTIKKLSVSDSTGSDSVVSMTPWSWYDFLFKTEITKKYL